MIQKPQNPQILLSLHGTLYTSMMHICYIDIMIIIIVSVSHFLPANDHQQEQSSYVFLPESVELYSLVLAPIDKKNNNYTVHREIIYI